MNFENTLACQNCAGWVRVKKTKPDTTVVFTVAFTVAVNTESFPERCSPNASARWPERAVCTDRQGEGSKAAPSPFHEWGGFCPTQLFLQVLQVPLALQHIQGFLPRGLLTRTVMMVTQTHRNQNDEENSQKEPYKKSYRAQFYLEREKQNLNFQGMAT